VVESFNAGITLTKHRAESKHQTFSAGDVKPAWSNSGKVSRSKSKVSLFEVVGLTNSNLLEHDFVDCEPGFEYSGRQNAAPQYVLSIIQSTEQWRQTDCCFHKENKVYRAKGKMPHRRLVIPRGCECIRPILSPFHHMVPLTHINQPLPTNGISISPAVFAQLTRLPNTRIGTSLRATSVDYDHPPSC